MSLSCVHGRLARSCEVCEAWNDHATACEQNETLRARIAELEAQCESAHAAQRHAETELAQYMAWYAMAEHQHLHEKARAERAEANAANWEEQANDRVSDWDEVRAERDALRALLKDVREGVDMIGCSSEGYDSLRTYRDELLARIDTAIDAAMRGGGMSFDLEACADSCGVPVCSEACDREARREHDGRDAERMKWLADYMVEIEYEPTPEETVCIWLLMNKELRRERYETSDLRAAIDAAMRAEG